MLISSWEPTVSETAIVALAGRRIDAEGADHRRFPAANIPIVRDRLKELFRREDVVAIVSSAACGSDIIGLEEAEKIHIRRRIVLPFAPERFRASSVVDRPGEWGSAFDRLVAIAEREDELIIVGQADGDTAYAASNQRIIEEAQLLSRRLSGGQHRLLAVVVWEGQPRPNNDLTDHFRTAAIKAGFEVEVVLTT
jgi:hypothetical protein